MKRAGLWALLVSCALAGGLLSVVLAGPLPASILTTSGTTATTVDTTATETTGETTTTTSPTPTTPKPPKPPKPSRPKVVARGVTIAGVPVGGLPRAAAAILVRDSFASPLVLRAGARTLRRTPRQLGANAYVKNAVLRALRARPNASIPLYVRVRGETVRAYVEGISQRALREPVDSRLLLRGSAPFITKGVPGRRIDRAPSVAAIVRALRTHRRGPLRLPAVDVTPEVTRASFGSIVVIRRGSNRLHLYTGMRLRRTFGVATGQSRYPTPLGRFAIVTMARNPWWYPPDSDWAQGQEPVPPGPGNPLGTRWMGLTAPGVGIHGTPDGGSIGYSVSHGCIRMQIPDAEWLFTQVGVGTPVFIVSA